MFDNLLAMHVIVAAGRAEDGGAHFRAGPAAATPDTSFALVVLSYVGHHFFAFIVSLSEEPTPSQPPRHRWRHSTQLLRPEPDDSALCSRLDDSAPWTLVLSTIQHLVHTSTRREELAGY